jgi:hypothetical protein
VPVRLSFHSRWRFSPSSSPIVCKASASDADMITFGVAAPAVTPDEKEKRIRGREELRFDGLKDINTVRPSSRPDHHDVSCVSRVCCCYVDDSATECVVSHDPLAGSVVVVVAVVQRVHQPPGLVGVGAVRVQGVVSRRRGLDEALLAQHCQRGYINQPPPPAPAAPLPTARIMRVLCTHAYKCDQPRVRYPQSSTRCKRQGSTSSRSGARSSRSDRPWKETRTYSPWVRHPFLPSKSPKLSLSFARTPVRGS